jgi:hypothetical protein
LLFEAPTPLGFQIRVTRARWETIVTFKHPIMAGQEMVVRETLRNPSEIRRSRSDPGVLLFYRLERTGRWFCAVAKQLEADGFLITAYPTDAVKEGELIWRK